MFDFCESVLCDLGFHFVLQVVVVILTGKDCHITAHGAGSVSLQVACGGRVVSESCQFDYRTHQQDTHTDCTCTSGTQLNSDSK